MKQVRPIGIDLFCGAGGMSLGFEQAGFDIKASVDVDPVHCATHEFNFPQCKTICKSVSELRGSEIRQLADIETVEIDVVFGGAPCQGFSMIGKRALDDPRNSLVAEFKRLVLELNPRAFVFENVPGLTVGAHRQFLEELIQEFESSGYDVVWPYRVLQAANFGVPQSRRRLFIIGVRRGERLPDYPWQTFDVRRPTSPNPGPSVLDAIGDLPDVDEYPELLLSDTIPITLQAPSAYVQLLRGRIDPEDFSYEREWDPTVLTSSMRTVHTEVSKRRFAETPPGSVESISRFLRLDPDGLCNTLRAGTSAERGAHTSARPIHPYLPRCITVREAARLHSYPDWFRFHVTKWHGFRQVGNSVPPLLARAVAKQLIQAIGATQQRPSISIDLGRVELLQMDNTNAARYFGLKNYVSPKRTRVA